ncbi:hypothetical protein LMG23992_02244 [Cupriavidus laharis]|uniref:PD-(D/E)XK endonuclease-like domain-containing protein n=1 Tax=Cupriavidus laharis TaxID=151654 RepID=A0ABM8WY47_9BURK|nr:PD-(D/E)XK nuclease family protein [Cupriavidus laharis]CAG9172473.1 hypothetical protein LMG23992_02244 [Cupriavidus laharis]
MAAGHRHTIITQGRLAMRHLRLDAARNRRNGEQVLDIEQLAARLAGGFFLPLDDDTLLQALQAVLPRTDLGELEQIKMLPGLAGAAADTLRKVWRAGIDLQARAHEHPRLAAIARLESAVRDALPAATPCLPALIQAAMQRIDMAPALFGAITCVGMADIAPCWRPMLMALEHRLELRWVAGPRPVPNWLELASGNVTTAPPTTPAISVCSAATAQHEVIEAMRWARDLMASGRARPEEIAIAAVSPAEYDDDFLALRADANLDLHFVHGVSVLASRDGQAAAALADILVRGLSQVRMRRLARLCAGGSGLLGGLPSGWTRLLPAEAPMTSAAAWDRWLSRMRVEDWPDAQDHGAALRRALDLLGQGVQPAREAGEVLLRGRPLAIWRRALLAGPAAAVDVTLGTLKQDDGLEACAHVAWMPAASLAASPRRFVRLLGLNSSRWPRGVSEDRLLADHIVPSAELDPLPVSAADRRDFQIIVATTPDQVVLSRARRDAEGRLLGRSPLLHDMPEEVWLRRHGAMAHAFSETDRLLSRTDEFAALPQARAAVQCWQHWHGTSLTAHDGLVRPDHPIVAAALARTQSASSLSRLLRNPLGFAWQYIFGWRTPQSGSEPIVLDALSLGNLVHLVLDLAVQRLEARGGLASASPAAIDAAVRDATIEASAQWEAETPVPPAVIWSRTLDDARTLASRALRHRDPRLADAQAYAEVPFGGSAPRSSLHAAPWNTDDPVEIPGTGIRIKGYIDRIDISRDGRLAAVTDYKTGRPIKPDDRLRGGKELQRCLYAFAVRALLGTEIDIHAALLFPREDLALPLVDPVQTLDEVTCHLRTAQQSLLGGALVAGADTGSDYDDLRFALPANASATYLRRKQAAVLERLGAAAQVWDAK